MIIEPPVLTRGQVLAIKAVNAGEATPEQQKAALAVIVSLVSNVHDLSWRPDQNLTSFNEGRRFVGLQILKFISQSVEELHVRRDSSDPGTREVSA